VQTERRYYLMSLISSYGSSFGITFLAVYGSASVGFKRNFAFLSTVGADCFMHFSRSSIRHANRTSLIMFNEELALSGILILACSIN